MIYLPNHLVRFAIQLISNTHTNCDYSMVCISVYGRRGSFFNISCIKTLFCPEISLVRSDSHSLTLPLSSDTSQVAFHSVQIRSEVHTVSILPLYFCIRSANTVLNIQIFCLCTRGYPSSSHTNDIIGNLAFI